jgi:UDPglucose 6-dehydrogenase
LRAGKITIYEPGLDQLVSKNIDSGRLSFTTSYKEALKDVEVILICVGTPPKPDGSYDSQFVYAAAESIAKNLTREAVVVIKSTVPPSTSQKVREIISKTAKVKFSVASVPEFLREGQAVNDALHPNRVVIGVDSPKAERVLVKLHEKFKAPILVMAPESAQLVKYASNAFLATKISFINAIAILADKVGADVMDVAKGLGMDPRIGAAFLNPGLGYGGSCFPKDTWALISFAKKLGYDFKFLKEVDQVNNLQVDYLIDKIESALGKLNTKTVSILGLAFKPNTDDTREARSTVLISKLKKLGVLVKTYDPVVKGDYDDVYLALTNSDALVLVTEWSEFDELDWKRVKRVMRQPNVFDGRNALNPEKLKKLGFNYWGIGRR